MSSFKFSSTSLERMAGVDPRLIEIANLALKLTKFDFGIPEHGGIRTAGEQYELFRDGKSKCDGYNKPSNHQSGLALDVYAYVNGAASWREYHLAMVAAAMLQAAAMLGYKLSWGGLWDWQDMPHFELLEDI